MAKKVDAYQCDHCGDLDTSLVEIRSHEEECEYNPSKKNCHTCKHSSMQTIHSRCGTGYGMWCSKFQTNCAYEGEWKYSNCQKHEVDNG